MDATLRPGFGFGSNTERISRYLNQQPEWPRLVKGIARSKEWTAQESGKNHLEVAAVVLETFKNVLATHELSRWFKFMDLGLGGIRMLHHAKLILETAKPGTDPSRTERNQIEIGKVWLELGTIMRELEEGCNIILMRKLVKEQVRLYPSLSTKQFRISN